MTTRLAVIAAPISCILAGLLEFVVLDGVDAFPLLALALAPFVMGSALLMTRPNPVLAGFGRINLVFIVLLFLPTNPQSYDPQAFLFTCLFLLLATLLLAAIQIVLPPLSGERRIRWLAKSARRDLAALEAGAGPRLAPEEAAFRDAARIGTMMMAGGSAPQNQAVLTEAMRLLRPRRAAAALRRRRVRRPLQRPPSPEGALTAMFSELIIGGVLIAPAVSYAVVALVVILVLRPLLRAVGFTRFVSNPALAELGLYVTIFSLLLQFA